MDQSLDAIFRGDNISPPISTKVVQQGPGNAARNIYNGPVHIHFYYPNPDGLPFSNVNRSPAAVPSTHGMMNQPVNQTNMHSHSHNQTRYNQGLPPLAELKGTMVPRTVIDTDDQRHNAEPMALPSLWDILRGVFSRRRRQARIY